MNILSSRKIIKIFLLTSGSLNSLLCEAWNELSKSTRGMSFKSEKSNSSRITMVNQNLDQDPDLDPNSGPSQGVKVGSDLDQTPGHL